MMNQKYVDNKMKIFEIEEALQIIRNINGMLLIFGATSKTNSLLLEYIQTLIIELQNQNQEILKETFGVDNSPYIDKQIDFLKYLISIIKNEEIIIDIQSKSTNNPVN